MRTFPLSAAQRGSWARRRQTDQRHAGRELVRGSHEHGRTVHGQCIDHQAFTVDRNWLDGQALRRRYLGERGPAGVFDRQPRPRRGVEEPTELPHRVGRARGDQHAVRVGIHAADPA